MVSLRCSERRWIPRTRAASEMFPAQSASTLWMCSHSTRASVGTVGTGLVSLGVQFTALQLLERGDDLIDVDRLAQIVVGAAFDGAQCGGDAAVSGQHDDRARVVDGAELGDQIQSVDVGHPQVDEDEIGALLPGLRQGLDRDRRPPRRPSPARGKRAASETGTLRRRRRSGRCGSLRRPLELAHVQGKVRSGLWCHWPGAES